MEPAAPSLQVQPPRRRALPSSQRWVRQPPRESLPQVLRRNRCRACLPSSRRRRARGSPQAWPHQPQRQSAPPALDRLPASPASRERPQRERPHRWPPRDWRLNLPRKARRPRHTQRATPILRRSPATMPESATNFWVTSHCLRKGRENRQPTKGNREWTGVDLKCVRGISRVMIIVWRNRSRKLRWHFLMNSFARVHSRR